MIGGNGRFEVVFADLTTDSTARQVGEATGN